MIYQPRPETLRLSLLWLILNICVMGQIFRGALIIANRAADGEIGRQLAINFDTAYVVRFVLASAGIGVCWPLLRWVNHAVHTNTITRRQPPMADDLPALAGSNAGHGNQRYLDGP